MKATIDSDGRVALGRELQTQIGLKPGDDVIIERQGDELVIKAAKPATGLSLEGNVLVHRGVWTRSVDSALSDDRDERFEQLTQGLSR